MKLLKCKFPDAFIASNDMSINQAKSFFRNVDRVVTNSYHFAYWSFLSGRKVKLLGYSTKFINLLKIFNISPGAIRKYSKDDQLDLINNIIVAVDHDNFIYVKNYKFFLNYFKRLNLEFADAINNSNLGIQISLRDKITERRVF